MELFSTLAMDPPRAHLRLVGELDGFAASLLRARLDEAAFAGCTEYVVDLSGVSFVDAGGLGVLIRLRNIVMALGGSVEFAAASTSFRWVARLALLETTFGLDRLPSEADASSFRAS